MKILGDALSSIRICQHVIAYTIYGDRQEVGVAHSTIALVNHLQVTRYMLYTVVSAMSINLSNMRADNASLIL